MIRARASKTHAPYLRQTSQNSGSLAGMACICIQPWDLWAWFPSVFSSLPWTKLHILVGYRQDLG